MKFNIVFMSDMPAAMLEQVVEGMKAYARQTGGEVSPTVNPPPGFRFLTSSPAHPFPVDPRAPAPVVTAVIGDRQIDLTAAEVSKILNEKNAQLACVISQKAQLDEMVNRHANTIDKQTQLIADLQRAAEKYRPEKRSHKKKAPFKFNMPKIKVTPRPPAKRKAR